MSFSEIPAAFKHGIYTATAVLPGEDPAEFEKVRRDIFAEFDLKGALEMRKFADKTQDPHAKENDFDCA